MARLEFGRLAHGFLSEPEDGIAVRDDSDSREGRRWAKAQQQG